MTLRSNDDPGCMTCGLWWLPPQDARGVLPAYDEVLLSLLDPGAEVPEPARWSTRFRACRCCLRLRAAGYDPEAIARSDERVDGLPVVAAARTAARLCRERGAEALYRDGRVVTSHPVSAEIAAGILVASAPHGLAAAVTPVGDGGRFEIAIDPRTCPGGGTPPGDERAERAATMDQLATRAGDRAVRAMDPRGNLIGACEGAYEQELLWCMGQTLPLLRRRLGSEGLDSEATSEAPADLAGDSDAGKVLSLLLLAKEDCRVLAAMGARTHAAWKLRQRASIVLMSLGDRADEKTSERTTEQRAEFSRLYALADEHAEAAEARCRELTRAAEGTGSLSEASVVAARHHETECRFWNDLVATCDEVSLGLRPVEDVDRLTAQHGLRGGLASIESTEPGIATVGRLGTMPPEDASSSAPESARQEVDVLTPDGLNALVATSRVSRPLAWSPWPRRSGWLRAEVPDGSRTRTYEIAERLGEADRGLTILVEWPVTTGDPWALVVGRERLHEEP